MGERTRYAPGTFCWTDLATTDQESAKGFYGDLFGWEAEDLPVGEGAVYSMMRIGGNDVAAIGPQPQQQRDAGVPPLWQSYVSVESADDTAARSAQLGATVHMEAFDVMDAGRMAVVQDPQGAWVMLWEPRRHFGASLVNAPGALCWNELASPDLDASKAFYAGLFGWTIEPFEGSPMPYMTIKNGDANNGGIRGMQPGEPPNWSVYFATEEIDGGLARVEELGGSKVHEPVDIGMAKIAGVRDRQGAFFSLYAGQLEP